jgi:membrane-bound serine protease (ClpP class)
VHSYRILRGALLVVVLWSAVLITTAPAQDAPRRIAITAEIKGAIGPATSRFVEKAIRKAEADKAEVLIFELNTPGGLVTSMRDIIEYILGSHVPIVGYVSPSGAHAASAGTYILYATNIAAMAPGTNIGAATPVQIGTPGLPGLPEQPKDKKNEPTAKPASNQDALSQKAMNDSVSLIRSLAILRGRNVDWAEKAVREAATLHEREALQQHAIEIVASDVNELLTALNGRKVTVGKTVHVLSTGGLTVERYEPDAVTKLLGVISNPEIALFLVLIGMYGLIFELANPGHVVPGVVGAISLVLGMYALEQLPLDYAGLALLLLGIAFMVAEAFTPAFGVFGIGGIVAFIAGAAMLVDSDVPEFQLSWSVIITSAAVSAGFLTLLIGYMWRVHGLRVRSGIEQMLGSKVVVVEWAGVEGAVWVQGERWSARGDRAYAIGDELVVRKIDGLTLVVTAPPFPEA